MDGRDFARFHVDVGIGDELLKPLDVLTRQEWLGFGGVSSPSFRVISAEQQFAEKLHAYNGIVLDWVTSFSPRMAR